MGNKLTAQNYLPWLSIILIFTATLFIFYPALTTYFSQDDFFHFKVSQTDGSLSGFANLFGFHPFEERKIAFYRPITRELPFNLSYRFFGLNPLPLRVLSFALVFGDIYMTYLLISKLFGNKTIGWFSAFFVGISSANTASLYYLAGGIQTIGATFFMLLCLLLFDRHKVWSFAAFLLALGSEEQAAVLPLLLGGLLFTKYPIKVAFKKAIATLLPHILIVIALALADYFLIGMSHGEAQYGLNFSFKRMVNTLSWYTAWALGLPEMLIDFVLPGLKLKPALLKYWPHYYKPILFGFFTVLTALLGSKPRKGRRKTDITSGTPIPNYPFIAKEWGSTSKQAAFVLNNEDALQLLYKDPSLRVFYEDLAGVPEDFPKDKLVTVVADLQ